MIFKNAVDDTEALLDLITEETDEKMLLVWNYHLFLNGQIISSILNHNLTLTARLIAELKRSIEATTKYCLATNQFAPNGANF